MGRKEDFEHEQWLARQGFAPLTQMPHDPDSPKGPWGRGPKYSDQWSQAKVRKVPIAGLHATQQHIEPATLDMYRRGETGPGSRTLPRVVTEAGSNFLIDGHHRAITAQERGETHIRAKVWEDL